jgi:hypothetical protein
MIRYTFFMFTVLGIAATAIAGVQAEAGSTSWNPENVTVLQKNQAFPVYGPIILEKCAKEDCSDAGE